MSVEAAAPAVAPAALPTPTQILAASMGKPPAAEVKPEAAPVAPATEAPPEKKPDASRFAALARKESEIQKKAEAFKAREAEVAAKHAAVEAFEKAKANATLDPLAFLEATGLTYEQLTEFVLNGKKPTPDAQVQAVRDELGRFTKKQEEDRKAALEAEKARIEAESAAEVKAFHEAAISFVAEHASDYELTMLHEGASLVPGLIETNFASTGKILSYKEAADMVEAHLAEQVEASITKTTKFKSKYAPAAPQTASTTEKPANAPATRPTLTNAIGASTPSTAPRKMRTEEERMAAAMAKLG